MNDKVSIIVPVHNTENYIENCLNSLLNQTYKNIEIILVENGSTDDSLNKIKEYAKKNERIKILISNKLGVSPARNLGIKNSSGKYIAFVDSDDYVSEDYIFELISHYNDDICMTMSAYYLVTGSEYRICIDEFCESIMSAETLKDNLSQVVGGGYTLNKLFKKEIIDDFKLTFDEDVRILEDYLFCIRYLEFCGNQNVAYTRRPLYFYVRREGSASQSSKSNFDATKLIALKQILELAKDGTRLKYDTEKDYANLLVAVNWHNKFGNSTVREKIGTFIFMLRQWNLLTNKHRLAVVLLFIYIFM